ncbi:hypothetical protein PO909_028161 [Leuciscus waleckii]
MAMLKSCLLLFVIFSMGNTEVDLARKCPATWIKFRRRCYKYFSHPTKWITAEKNCQSLGANLASVRKKLENDFLLSLLPSSTQTWIGAHSAVDGHWMWSDGTVFLYTHWCAGEPNNYKGLEKCLEINYSCKNAVCFLILSIIIYNPTILHHTVT